MDKIAIADFSGKQFTKRTNELTQWSYGQMLKITGITLQDEFEIHFSLEERSGLAQKCEASMEDNEITIEIPQFVFETNKTRNYEVYAFIYITAPEYGYTGYKIIIPVVSRPKPEDYIYSPREVKKWEDHENRIKTLEDEDVKQGNDGKSAYEYAKDGGYTGTEEEFAEKLAQEWASAEDVNKHKTDSNIHVTSEEKKAWNDKSNFSGNYNDLTNKPPIPSKASDVGADASGTAASAVSTHNTSTESHNDIRLLIEGLTTRFNNMMDSDDTTLDQASEFIAYIKANRTLIESITTTKVNVSDIIDNLTTSVSNKPLSAKQGVQLKALIDAISVPTLLSQLGEDATHRTVTDAEKEIWNNKSDFGGTFSDLTEKPKTLAGYGITDGVTREEVNELSQTIPKKTSQLTNDSEFITNTVNNLANYYLKSETYTRDEVKALISAIPKFAIKPVDGLPTTDISETTVYLVKSGDETDNLYTEYINVNGAWEYLGKQTVDLSGYALSSELPTKLTDLENDAGFITNAVTVLVNFYNKTQIDNLLANATSVTYDSTTKTLNISSGGGNN